MTNYKIYILIAPTNRFQFHENFIIFFISRWRDLIDFYYCLPFPRNSELKKDLKILKKTVTDIITKKRQHIAQLEEKGGIVIFP